MATLLVFDFWTFCSLFRKSARADFYGYFFSLISHFNIPDPAPGRVYRSQCFHAAALFFGLF